MKRGGKRRKVMLGGLIRECFGKREIAVREVTILLSIYNIKLIFNIKFEDL